MLLCITPSGDSSSAVAYNPPDGLATGQPDTKERNRGPND